MKQFARQFPPVTREELNERGITQPDFIFVTGDAYIDHPSFGAAIITRLLESRGYSVALIVQPDWHDAKAFAALGVPKLAFLVASGNMDSMVNHYSVSGARRKTDAYTENGAAGKRPDRACIVYANRCREAFRHVPLILGGVEASLRRMAHYDYWDDRVRHSILYDAGADILVYGMGERAIVQIADALAAGTPVGEIAALPGTCVRVSSPEDAPDAVVLPSYSEVASDKRKYAQAFAAQAREQDAVRGRRLIQPHEKGCLLCNPPAMPLSAEELDEVYALPYTRRPHPMIKGHVPALDEVSFSITSSRGCFGNCSFCALTFHQGRVVTARSQESIIDEAKRLTKEPDFKGYIHDVGGPTANFRHPACTKQLKSGACAERECLGFAACKNVDASEADYTSLLKKLRALPGVKKVFVRSGVRYDYALLDRDDAFLRELISHHISGQLKVAPEHVSDRVLRYMNKPPHAVYERFVQKYEALNKSLGMKQFLVPYLISSHPGSTLDDAIELALYLKKTGHKPEQVQDFYPTPGTASTCMFYTGLDPKTMRPVYVPKSREEKAMQRALMQCHVRKNWPLIRKALKKAGRDDLIGPGGLVPADGGGRPPSGVKKPVNPGKKQAAEGKNRHGGQYAPPKKGGARKKRGGQPR
ncbi:MAG TPA: YgiQ family radical SAM protein [Eubacteriales bacterium]|nr:YgiQ family radical SAM protein [Eubacteriales bacterium]